MTLMCLQFWYRVCKFNAVNSLVGNGRTGMIKIHRRDGSTDMRSMLETAHKSLYLHKFSVLGNYLLFLTYDTSNFH